MTTESGETILGRGGGSAHSSFTDDFILIFSGASIFHSRSMSYRLGLSPSSALDVQHVIITNQSAHHRLVRNGYMTSPSPSAIFSGLLQETLGMAFFILKSWKLMEATAVIFNPQGETLPEKWVSIKESQEME